MEERRATFQKTDISEGGTPHPCFSINLSKVQVLLTSLVAIATLLTFIIGGVHWARVAVDKAAMSGFEDAARRFYESIIEERNSYYVGLVDSKIQTHRLATEAKIDARLDGMNAVIIVNGANVSTLVRQNEHLQKTVEEILFRMKNGTH